jgi:YfiH family protein
MPLERITSPDGVVWLRSPLLHAAGVPHGFSTRLGGVSGPPFGSLNLGVAQAPGEPDSWQNVQENWRRFLASVHMPQRVLVRARQVHGAGVVQADRQPEAVRVDPPFVEGDALVTSDADQCVAVRVADCAPLLLADPHAGVVAAVHAGWRGVVAGVLPAAIAAMVGRGASPHRLLLAVGPCIGPDAFEVGAEVARAFDACDLHNAVLPHAAKSSKAKVDLVQAFVIQAVRAGLSRSTIDSADFCTVLRQDLCFSYRREGPRSGRMAAVIAGP